MKMKKKRINKDKMINKYKRSIKLYVRRIKKMKKRKNRLDRNFQNLIQSHNKIQMKNKFNRIILF